jgi:hypothetical protein
MGAFNWIVLTDKCPNCKKIAKIKCQTHVASSFDGDSTGAFRNREYEIGDIMRWWSKEDARFNEWRVNGKKVNNRPETKDDFECCYAICSNCDAELYALIRFEENKPVELLDVGLEESWPEEYYK